MNGFLRTTPRCLSTRRRFIPWVWVVLSSVSLMPSAHAELLFDSVPPAANAATDDASPNAASDASEDDGDVLFNKVAPVVIPHRSKDMQCAPLNHPKGWDRALGWRPSGQPLPNWGWSRDRWCGNLDHVLDRLNEPISRLTRWASCEGTVALGGVRTPPVAQMCDHPSEAQDWVELRPSLTIYSWGNWVPTGSSGPIGPSCPSVLVEIKQLVGALSGARAYVVVPLEGNCTMVDDANTLINAWSVPQGLTAYGLAHWNGYDGSVPDAVPLGSWVPNPAVVGTAVPASSTTTTPLAPATVPSAPASVAVQPPLLTYKR